MNYFLRMMLVFFCLCAAVFADHLEIKVDGKEINLSHWPAQKEPYVAVILVNGGAQTQSLVLLEHLANQLSKNGWLVVLMNDGANDYIPWFKKLPEVITLLGSFPFKGAALITHRAP
ncbi:MAG: hypothetical protein ACRCXC_10450 [Legionella sp.]